MVVFNEHFHIEKNKIQRYVEHQQKLEKTTKSQGKEDKNEDKPKSSMSGIPGRVSWNDIIAEISRDTAEKLRESEEMDKRIMEVHKMIENIDDLNSYVASSENIKTTAKEVKSESENTDNQDISNNKEGTKRVGKKNEDRARNLGIVPKRVQKLLEESDSSSEISDYKPPRIKPTKASILKSKFNAERNRKSDSSQISSAPNSTPRISVKFDFTKKTDNKRMTESVKKILNDAKEKHKAKNSAKSNIPVNVLDLFLL